MKYFIGYLIQGDAAEWYYETAKKISEKFDTWKIHEKIPSHITIFRPFDVENIDLIKKIISKWTQDYSEKSILKIVDFDHFDNRVIFGKIDADEVLIKNIEKFQKYIESQNINPVKDYPSKWHPHMTLVNYIDSIRFDEIWRYVLMLDKPKFILPFNNVSLFRSKGNREWGVEHYFPISNF